MFELIVTTRPTGMTEARELEIIALIEARVDEALTDVEGRVAFIVDPITK